MLDNIEILARTRPIEMAPMVTLAIANTVKYYLTAFIVYKQI